MDGTQNFHILILNEEERRAYAQQLSVLVPGMPQASIDRIVDLPRSNFCAVSAFVGSRKDAAISAAVAIIRAELPDQLRASCIHEELAQGMGLANDSPSVSPSIFNDNEEFGLMTRHDELLLQMLYDPRLEIGMDEEQATPIVRRISQELLPSGET